ncbi:tetratricopeptide repeat protein [Rhodovibrionaceae bacterium A322]
MFTSNSFDIPQMLRSALQQQQQGNLDGAESLLKQVLARQPRHSDALKLLGMLRFQQDNPKEAERLLLKAIKVKPDGASYLHDLGVIRQSLGKKDAAIKAFQKAAALRPNEAARQEALAVALLTNKQIDLGISHLNKALELEPQRVSALVRLADIHQQEGRQEEALSLYEQALELAPDYAPAHNNRGSALQGLGRPLEAAQAHQKALDLNDQVPNYWLNLGVAEMAAKNPQAALKAFDHCLVLDPMDRRGLAYRLIATGELGLQDKEAVARELQDWINPQHLETPKGYSDLADLNRHLAKDLLSHRSLTWEPLGTATTGGSDILNLMQYPTKSIRAFHGALIQALTRYIETLSRQQGHPLLDRLPQDWELDIWSTVFKSQGYQHAHVHPTGWLSGVYYVQLPDAEAQKEETAGWIEFGRPEDTFDVSFDPVVRLCETQEGVAFFFPSHLYHRTIPFDGTRERIAIAFDVRPTSWRD